MNGKTIEINNTDAEGRLILADALNYAIEDGAERIVNLATLTGAIIVALGSTHAGLFSNDDDWCAEVDAACTETGEIGWRLPLHAEYAELVKGTYADLDNAPEGRKASSITAAEFLKAFVGDMPWVHMDIAGTAWGLGRPYVGKGASGFGVRLLVELARRTADGLPKRSVRSRPDLAALAAIALALPVATGCGAPDELSRADARELADARERLDDAIDTEETLRTSKAEARRLRAGVREIVARGAFEAGDWTSSAWPRSASWGRWCRAWW